MKKPSKLNLARLILTLVTITAFVGFFVQHHSATDNCGARGEGFFGIFGLAATVLVGFLVMPRALKVKNRLRKTLAIIGSVILVLVILGTLWATAFGLYFCF